MQCRSVHVVLSGVDNGHLSIVKYTVSIIDNKHAFQGPVISVMSESHLLVNTMLLLRLLTSVMLIRKMSQRLRETARNRDR